MIQFTSGDLLQAQTQYIAQGVATGSQEGLGTGLALKISTKWPDVQQQFKKYTRSSTFAGGDVFAVAPTADRPGVIYIATQPDMYHATLNYLNKGLRNLVKFCVKHKVESVALPKVGAGLGKLDWETEVKPLMSKYFAEGSSQFVIYENFKQQYEQLQAD
ncbi:MAG TPA: macro domain-containing protein [Abditibacteriaceae bacterium]|jgi:O-acetyl-ADP-ribose deacetylase (regulator of RNase III)